MYFRIRGGEEDAMKVLSQVNKQVGPILGPRGKHHFQRVQGPELYKTTTVCLPKPEDLAHPGF